MGDANPFIEMVVPRLIVVTFVMLAVQATLAVSVDLVSSSLVGSWNSSFADKSPASDGELKCLHQKDHRVKNCPRQVIRECLTQISVKLANGKEIRDHNTCTSCKAGYAFAFIYHKSRAGSCGLFGYVPTVIQARMDHDSRGGPTHSNTVNTKILLSAHLLWHNSISNKTVAEAFDGTMGKYEDGKKVAMVKCRVWKQVSISLRPAASICSRIDRILLWQVIRRGSICSNKKEVECLEICKAVKRLDACDTKNSEGKPADQAHFRKTSNIYKTQKKYCKSNDQKELPVYEHTDCDKSYCKDYGSIACHTAALLE